MVPVGGVVAVLGVLSLALVTEEAVFNLALPFPGIPLLSGGIIWDHLKVTYKPWLPGVFDIPLSSSNIGTEYKFLKKHEEFSQVSLYCYIGDPRVCFMYDDKKNICGMRVAFVINHLKDRAPKGEFPYSFDDKPIFKKGSAMGKDLYYTDIFFINPDILKNGEPSTRAEPVGTGVYVNIDGKSWVEMPRDEKDTEKTDFTRHKCFLGMGRHYYYKMTKTMKCEDLIPVFLLYHGGQLIGFGIEIFGSIDPNFGRPWFENPPKQLIKIIAPEGPKCFSEWTEKYGATSLHVYFRSFNALTCVL